jgi:hypothetical protein
MWLWAKVRTILSPSVIALPGQLQTNNSTYVFCPNAAGCSKKLRKTNLNCRQKCTFKLSTATRATWSTTNSIQIFV